jgi:hypothetical protein
MTNQFKKSQFKNSYIYFPIKNPKKPAHFTKSHKNQTHPKFSSMDQTNFQRSEQKTHAAFKNSDKERKKARNEKISKTRSGAKTSVGRRL